MPSALIDLDVAPATDHRPGRSAPRGRTALAVLGLLLLALLGPARPAHLKATLIAAQSQDSVFVNGDRLYVIDAAHLMRTFRLPDGMLLARTTLQIPEVVAGVLPIGDTTLIQTTVGERPAVMAVDGATGLSRWWQFGTARAASAAAGQVLVADGGADDFEAVDLRTGSFRWEVPTPPGGTLSMAGFGAGLPRWLVAQGPYGRLDTYDGSTGKHLATAQATMGPLVGAAGDLFVIGGSRDAVTAYALPGLTTRWQISPAGVSGASLGPDCGVVLCVLGPTLMTALDPATGRTRWTSRRFRSAQAAGDLLLASDADGAPDLVPFSVLDPATGRVRADLGGWRGVGDLTYVVHPGPSTSLFGRFEPATNRVRILGTTDQAFRHCDAGAGTVVCHLTDGPVAIWRLG